jgi:hypothetical protein
MMFLAQWQNLIAVPSYHYHPVFAQAVRQVIEQYAPDAIAVEIPDFVRADLDWALDQFPVPVGVHLPDGNLMPLLPGDSLYEASHLARQYNIPLFLIDIYVRGSTSPPSNKLRPDPMFAQRSPRHFLDVARVNRTQGQLSEIDQVREAFMARKLKTLLTQYRCVLWVGGIDQWFSLVDFLEKPQVSRLNAPRLKYAQCQRLYLSPASVYLLTGRTLYHVLHYSNNPAQYDEVHTAWHLTLDAVQSYISAFGSSAFCRPITPTAISQMLIYARNIAATQGFRETPTFHELCTSAIATIGRAYASHLRRLALPPLIKVEKRDYPTLIVEAGDVPRLRFGDIWVQPQSYWQAWEPPDHGLLGGEPLEDSVERPNAVQPTRETTHGESQHDIHWVMYPREERAYEQFVRYVLEHLPATSVKQETSLPFTAGIRNGIDMHNTLRHWHEHTIYIRQHDNTSRPITNGCIDWVHRSEDDDELQGNGAPIGWVEHMFRHVGSVSVETAMLPVEQEEPYRVWPRQRRFSFITLDSVNNPGSVDNQGINSFVHVIQHLVDIPADHQTLYQWLDIMFRYCKGKSFVYYSHYRPGKRVFAIAQRYRVHVLHIPLSRLPVHLYQQHLNFRFVVLTDAQYRAWYMPDHPL